NFTGFRAEAGIHAGNVCFLLPSSVNGSINQMFPFAAVSQSGADLVEITGLYVKVYASPDKSSSVVVLAEQGQRFSIEKIEGEWFQILVMDTPGWVSSKEAKLYDPAAEQKALAAQKQAEEQARLDSLQKAEEQAEAEAEEKKQQEETQKERPENRQAKAKQDVPGAKEQDTPRPNTRQQSRPTPARQRTARRRLEQKNSEAQRNTPPTPAVSQPRSETQQVSDTSPVDSEETGIDTAQERLSAPIDPSRVGPMNNAAAPEKTAPAEEKSFSDKLGEFGSSVSETMQSFVAGVKNVSESVFSRFSRSRSSEPQRSGTGPQKDSEPKATNQKNQQRYVQVVQGPVRVLQELNPESPILGMANRGAHFPLINAGDSWVKILYKNNEGWVERRYLSIVDAPSSIIVKDFLWLLVGLVVLVVIVIIIRLILARFDKVRNEWFESVAVEKKILLVARGEKSIQRYLTNTPTTLHKTFSELGFTINIAPSVQDVHRILTHFLPDFIAVDWTMQQNIFPAIEHILTSRASTANLLTLFYNVPSPEHAPRSRKLPNAHYFGAMFNDRDIFSLVTPLISRSSTQQQSIQKSVEEAALTGDVADGSLAEVFQFAEIGRKTGCLLLEDKKPFGLVFFNKGIIIYAATRKNVAREAVFDILNLEEGRFRFVLNKKPQNSNCKLPTLGILMEWTKEIDEAHGR
ncbi:MAG: DUF4388 domain-containing protein, partial [Chitinivibrionales bacterium]